MNPWMIDLIKIGVVFGALIGSVHVMVYLERKISAGIQGRIGPNLVGPFGFLQPLADALKMVFKEDIIPTRADRFLYVLAPLFVVVPPVVAFAVIPFGNTLEIGGYKMSLQVAPTGLGLLIALAVLSVSVYGLVFSAWASNNKYALLGGLRSSAQMISYELALGLTALSVVVLTATVDMQKIVEAQMGALWNWHLFKMPIVALIFFIAALAECNRLPFDLPEAEAELVGGYHTEYASVKFAMFFMGEYIAIVTMSALFVTLFLGGWYFPGLTDPKDHSVGAAFASVAVFAAKMAVILFLYIVIRWTLPRFKYQRLMDFGWKCLLPLSLVNIVGYGIVRVL